MTETSWTIKGREFVHCNCAYGCPCQFNALPTKGHCQAVAGVSIDEGRHGETDLAGLSIAMVVAWVLFRLFGDQGLICPPMPVVYRGPYEYSAPDHPEDYWPQNAPPAAMPSPEPVPAIGR